MLVASHQDRLQEHIVILSFPDTNTRMTYLDALEECARKCPTNAFSYLEVGFGCGRSLRRVLLSNPPRRVAVCDAFNNTYGGRYDEEAGEATLGRLCDELQFPRAQVELLVGDSRETMGTIRGEFELILVDGDHSEGGARSDLSFVDQLSMPGTVLIFDDTHHRKHRHLLNVWQDWLANRHEAWIGATYPVGNGYGIARRER